MFNRSIQYKWIEKLKLPYYNLWQNTWFFVMITSWSQHSLFMFFKLINFAYLPLNDDSFLLFKVLWESLNNASKSISSDDGGRLTSPSSRQLVLESSNEIHESYYSHCFHGSTSLFNFLKDRVQPQTNYHL